MKILCVDTSTRRNWVGLYEDGRVIGCVGYEDRQSCLINLMPSISTLLNNAQIRLSSLDGIATVIGPGAWSSLRIGMATVKQLCLVNHLPLFSVNNLDLIAEVALRQSMFPSGKSYLLTAMDAQSSRAYAALYRMDGLAKTQVSPYEWEPIETIAERIISQTKDTFVIGDALPLFNQHIAVSGTAFMPQTNSDYLRILGDLATEQNPTYDHDSIAMLKPLYIQPSSAEVEFNVSVT